MDWNDRVLLWKNDDKLINHLKKELYDITDENELEDRFYQYLEFGTGGMRGELGVGTNRINEYTIKRVALGLAIYIKSNGLEKMNQGVAISYDNRYFSKDFAQITACTLASYGIKVYLSDQMRPTPELSYAVRHYSCFLGVMITASHNPKNYNGFKVYDEDGGQITLNVANELQSILSEIKNELTISSNELSDYIEQGLILSFSKELDQSYLSKLNSVVLNEELIKSNGSDLKVVYTPLHGTGSVILPQALEKFGFSNLSIVNEQADSDPGFSTISYPNPEEKNAFNLALKLAEKSEADVVIATDPDADRLGIVIYDQGKPIYLNGNQIGVLLLDYLTKYKKDNKLENYFIAKTIVTSNLGEKIAQNYGIEVKNTLTGFKFIGEQIKISKEVNGKNFLFGYEESYGYLISPIVRDKDAIQAALLFSEVALVNKINNKEKSLMDTLDEIYQKYGYFEEDLVTYEFGSKQGLEKMNQMMELLRADKKIDFSCFAITKIADYLYQVVHDIRNNEIKSTQLPCSNVLKFIFEDDSWICFRPSGTEPKLKIYFSVTSVSKNSSKEKLEKLKKIAIDIISNIEFKLG